MDFEYIERLLNKYWECETTLREEEELRSFFNGKDIPTRLLRYKSLFVYQEQQQEEVLADDFDTRVLSLIEEVPVVKARRVTLISRMAPLFKAVAVIAAVLTISNIIQYVVTGGTNRVDYDYDAYVDTYEDPEVAYEQLSAAFQMLSEELGSIKNISLPDTMELNAIPDMQCE